MKFIPTLVVSLFSLLLIPSCKEILPERVEDTTVQDTTYITTNPSSAQERHVLVEEFTGASCVNCPEGHEILKELRTKYGDKIITIGLHHGGLSAPVYRDEEDLRTSEAASIASQFGSSSMPSALIDRAWFGGNIVIGRSSWNSAVEDRVALPPKVNISSSFNNQNGSYFYTFTIEFLEDFNNDVNYFVSLLESDIIVSQKDKSQTIPNYPQDHVLRKMYTAFSGKALEKPNQNNYEKGRIYTKTLEIPLDEKWNKDQLEMVLYVADASNNVVLQANHLKIKP